MRFFRGTAILFLFLQSIPGFCALKQTNAVWESAANAQYSTVVGLREPRQLVFYCFSDDTNKLTLSSYTGATYWFTDEPDASEASSGTNVAGTISDNVITFNPTTNTFTSLISGGYSEILLTDGTNSYVLARGVHNTVPAPGITVSEPFRANIIVDCSFYTWSNVYDYGMVQIRFGTTNSVATNSNGAVSYTINTNPPTAVATNVIASEVSYDDETYTNVQDALDALFADAGSTGAVTSVSGDDTYTTNSGTATDPIITLTPITTQSLALADAAYPGSNPSNYITVADVPAEADTNALVQLAIETNRAVQAEAALYPRSNPSNYIAAADVPAAETDPTWAAVSNSITSLAQGAVQRTGDDMTGDLGMGGNDITNANVISGGASLMSIDIANGQLRNAESPIVNWFSEELYSAGFLQLNWGYRSLFYNWTADTAPTLSNGIARLWDVWQGTNDVYQLAKDYADSISGVSPSVVTQIAEEVVSPYTNHQDRTDNPHSVTADQAGAVSSTGHGNNKFLITDGLGEVTTTDISRFPTTAGATQIAQNVVGVYTDLIVNAVQPDDTNGWETGSHADFVTDTDTNGWETGSHADFVQDSDTNGWETGSHADFVQDSDTNGWETGSHDGLVADVDTNGWVVSSHDDLVADTDTNGWEIGSHETFLESEIDPIYSAWVTNSSSGTTNAILPDGSLVDIASLLVDTDTCDLDNSTGDGNANLTNAVRAAILPSFSSDPVTFDSATSYTLNSNALWYCIPDLQTNTTITFSGWGSYRKEAVTVTVKNLNSKSITWAGFTFLCDTPTAATNIVTIYPYTNDTAVGIGK